MEATSVSTFALLRQQSAAAVVGSRVGSNLAPTVASRPALSKASTAVTATVSSTVTAAVSSTASTEVSTLQTANKALVEEKTALLSRLQADNRKLGLLFHDVTETKRRLIREIDDVQAEKARLKSLSVISHDDSLERLLKASMLSPNARKLLPIDKRALAEEVHAQLTQLVAQCRENQVNVLQVVRDKAEQVELGFRASTPEGTERMEAALGALKNIASTLPGNLLAAEAVAASLSEAMVCALVDKSSAILSRREASMAAGDYNAEDYQQDLFGGGEGSGVGAEAGGGGGGEGTGGGRGGAGGGGNAAALSVELKKVRNENDLLKKKISEMKKQHTSQLVKASEASKAAAQREAKTAVSPRGSPQKVVPAASAASLDSVRVTVDMDNDFNDLPEPVRAQALKVMAAHVLQTLRGNPLSGGLQMALLVATAEEISTQISGLVGGALKAFATQGDMDIKSTKSVEATVAKVLASPIRELSRDPLLFPPASPPSSHPCLENKTDPPPPMPQCFKRFHRTRH